MAKAVPMHPALEDAEPVAAYAGLRPAGVDANYIIRRSTADPRLILVGAIRSTGLSASLGIAEHVADLVAPGITAAPLRPGARVPMTGPWWLRGQRERPGHGVAGA
jgi:glycerol-3-phosphate dehydrogenase